MTVIHIKKPSTVHYLCEKATPETIGHFMFAIDPKKITAKEYYDLHFMIESHPVPRIKNFYNATWVGFNLCHKKDMLGAEGDSFTLSRFLKSKKTKQPATMAEWQQCKNEKDLQKSFILDSKLLKEDYKLQFKLLLDTLLDLNIEVGILRAAGCGNYGAGFRLEYQQSVADAYKEVLAENDYHFKHLILCEKDDATRKLFAATLDGLMMVSDRHPDTIATEFHRKQFVVCLVNPNCFASLKQNYHQAKNNLQFKGIGIANHEETSLEKTFTYLNTIVSNITNTDIITELQKTAWDKLSAACKKDENTIKQAQLYPELFKPYLINVEKFLQEHSQRAIEAEIRNIKSLFSTLSPDAFREEHLKAAYRLIKKCRSEAQKDVVISIIMSKFKEYLTKGHASPKEKSALLTSAQHYMAWKADQWPSHLKHH